MKQTRPLARQAAGTYGSEATPGLLDADLVDDWSRSTAERWLPDRALPERTNSPPSVTRAFAQATIIETAAVMAAAAQRTAGECSTSAARIAEWLSECLDGVAAADNETDPEQEIATFGARAGDRSETARRRWNAALRENIQRASIGWVRGRDEGPIEFTVSRLAGRWTIVEHGYATSESELSGPLISAVATATTRQAYAEGRRPAARGTLAEALRANVDEYCRTQPANPGGEPREGGPR